MSSYEATKDGWDEAIDGAGQEGSFISADVLIMYGIAFLLDMIGYFCLILTVTVALAPVAVIIQGITTVVGKFVFTLWIVFIRGHRPSFSLAVVAKKGFSLVKKGLQKIRSRQKEAPDDGGSDKEKPSSADDSRSPTETSTGTGEYYAPVQSSTGTGEYYAPVQSSTGTGVSYDSVQPSTADSPSSDDAPAAETQSSPEETAAPNKTTSLLMRWIKRVFIPWLVEITPVLGKIVPTWTLSVYFEEKNG